MNSKRLAVAFVVTFALSLAVSSGGVTEVAAQEGGLPAGPDAPQASLGSGFTYQGQLNSGGTPLTGNCDMEFSLWDVASGPPQRGGTEPEANVSVVAGKFTVILNDGLPFPTFGDTFVGEPRWLQVAVRCPPGSGAYTTLAPRQALTAVPYALGLQPGAEIYGVQADSVLYASNTGSGDGMNGYSSSATGILGGSLTGTGVRGESNLGWAMEAGGSVTQDASEGGWVKANLLVNGGGGGIARCFNSQSSPANANSLTCGFDVTRNSQGTYTVDFGFTVNDRFISITPHYAAQTAIVPIVHSFPAADQVKVMTLTGANALIDSDFFITVY